MKAADHHTTSFKEHWVFLVLSLLAISIAFYFYQFGAEEFRMIALKTSSSIFIAGILKIIFSRANRKNYKRAGWYLIGGAINIILSVAFFYYYISFYNDHLITNQIFFAFTGLWMLMNSFLNFAFAKELSGLNMPAAYPLLIMGIIGSFAAIAVILFAFVKPAGAIPVIIFTLVFIAIFNAWLFLYMNKNQVRS